MVVVGDHGKGLGDHGGDQHGFFIRKYAARPADRAAAKRRRRGRPNRRERKPYRPHAHGARLARRTNPRASLRREKLDDLAGTSRSNGSRPLYSESLWPEQYACAPVTAFWRQLEVHSFPKAGLDDLDRDGDEKVNLVDKEPQIARRLRGRLEERRRATAAAARPQTAAASPLGQDTLLAARILGYVSRWHGSWGTRFGTPGRKPKYLAVFSLQGGM